MYNEAMSTLVLINSYIKYAYYLLGLIFVICFIVLMKNAKFLAKAIEEINNSTSNVKQDINEINEKIDKIKYTLEHSVPLFAFIFFAIIVIKAAIKDYRNTKLSRRNFAKSTIKEYKAISSKYKLKHAKNFSRKFIKEIIKLA